MTCKIICKMYIYIIQKYENIYKIYIYIYIHISIKYIKIIYKIIYNIYILIIYKNI